MTIIRTVNIYSKLSSWNQVIDVTSTDTVDTLTLQLFAVVSGENQRFFEHLIVQQPVHVVIGITRVYLQLGNVLIFASKIRKLMSIIK